MPLTAAAAGPHHQEWIRRSRKQRLQETARQENNIQKVTAKQDRCEGRALLLASKQRSILFSVRTGNSGSKDYDDEDVDLCRVLLSRTRISFPSRIRLPPLQSSTRTMSQTPAWKEAATLIIVARASMSQKVGQSLSKSMVVASRVVRDEKHKVVASQSSAIAKTDYRIMMVKRSGLSSFMASAFVFPGGAVEVADYSPKWWDIFAKAGLSRDQVMHFRDEITGPRPQMVTEPLTLTNYRNAGHPDQDFLPADVGLRITAIRETFEETGVLLLTHPEKETSANVLSDIDDVHLDLSSWREKVRKDASAFIDLCIEAGLCPDLWLLSEWSNWLTPISVGHKRFDTMFYICCLEKQPKVVLDQTEVTTLKWCTPVEMLEEHVQERLFLAPPQVYELSRIHHLTSFNAVQDFSSGRNLLGSHRWLPVIATYRDGAISFLPGDSLYPDEPDIIGRKPVPDFPQALAEIHAKSPSLNRIELRGPTCTSLCNVKLPLGHLSPVTYPSQDVLQPSAPSML